MTAPYFKIEAGAEKKRLDFPAGASELVIGRSPSCELVITSGQISRRHARVLWRSGEATIEDLGSSNGTFVNGRRLSQPTALKSEDRVSLGTVDLKFVMPALEEEAAATVFAPQRAKATVEVARAVGPSTHEPAVDRPPAAAVAAKAPAAKPIPTPPAVPPKVPSFRAAAKPSSPASADDPSLVELAMIALGSFLAVFGIGAALIRFVF